MTKPNSACSAGHQGAVLPDRVDEHVNGAVHCVQDDAAARCDVEVPRREIRGQVVGHIPVAQDLTGPGAVIPPDLQPRRRARAPPGAQLQGHQRLTDQSRPGPFEMMDVSS